LAAEATSRVLGRKSDLIEGREIFLLYGRGESLLRAMSDSFRSFVQASALAVRIESWGSLWIRLSAEAFAFVSLVLVAFALDTGRIDATLAGVVISALFGITGSMGWLDYSTSRMSHSLPHIRRVFEFVDLPTEESEEGRPGRSPAASQGEDLVFAGYTMSYRVDTPRILDGLDLTIRRGAKTALIGRTGSGKTSVTQSLLRMVHVHGGDIRVGSRSAFDYELREYRGLFGVVPQFPYLFEGTLRANLDRVGTLGDARLREALEAVGLRLPLDHAIVEGGMNLSMGERQLACLARVIAADRPFILMDEPTSGLDPRTDARVNEVLRTALGGRTVLTIAHRPQSLHLYDHLVELSAGKVIWQGTPAQRGISR
jgi:ATP-binding cassette subfamily C (CFTR/MRP) protein 1